MCNLSVPTLVEKFGGIRPMAEALNCPHSTVNNWVRRGSIPSKNAQAIATAAKDKKLRITFDDILRLSAPQNTTPT